MSFRTMLLATSVAALLPLATIAPSHALDAGHQRHRHGGNQAELGFLAGVQLTDAQKEQVHQLLHAGFQQIRPLEQQSRALHQQISDQLASTAAVNSAQLTALQQQAGQLREQIDEQRLATALQVRALLTPDQLAQAAQIHQQLGSLHAQMRSLLGQSGGAPSAQ